MNKHPMATVDLAVSALGNLVVPLFLFGFSWWVAKWLLPGSDPEFGTPLLWASGITTVLIFLWANERPHARPADVSPNIPPHTKAHFAISMALTALYTVVFAVILGITGKAILGPWQSTVLSVAISLFALFHYRSRRLRFCWWRDRWCMSLKRWFVSTHSF